MDELNEQRCWKWIEIIEGLDFTHSSRRAWQLLNRLGFDNAETSSITKIKPDKIGEILLQMSSQN